MKRLKIAIFVFIIFILFSAQQDPNCINQSNQTWEFYGLDNNGNIIVTNTVKFVAGGSGTGQDGWHVHKSAGGNDCDVWVNFSVSIQGTLVTLKGFKETQLSTCSHDISLIGGGTGYTSDGLSYPNTWRAKGTLSITYLITGLGRSGGAGNWRAQRIK